MRDTGQPKVEPRDFVFLGPFVELVVHIRRDLAKVNEMAEKRKRVFELRDCGPQELQFECNAQNMLTGVELQK